MKRFKELCLGLLVLVALGSISMIASASASPTAVMLSPTENFPVELKSKSDNPNNGIKTELQNAAGVIKADGYLLEITLTSSTAGTFEQLILTFGNQKGELCTGEGEKSSGEVLLMGTVALVHDVSATSGVGLLLTILLVLVLCGTLKLHFEGSTLGLLKEPNKEETKFNTLLHCSTTIGEPAEHLYWNQSGTMADSLLLGNFGSGFKKSCYDVGLGTANLELTANKMVEFKE